MNKQMIFAFQGKTTDPYDPTTAIEISAKDFLTGEKDLAEVAKSFMDNPEAETLVIQCDTLDQLCSFELLMLRTPC